MMNVSTYMIFCIGVCADGGASALFPLRDTIYLYANRLYSAWLCHITCTPTRCWGKSAKNRV